MTGSASNDCFLAVRVGEASPEGGAAADRATDSPLLPARVACCSPGDLPQGEVTVRVLYSSLNYKDALSAAGNRGVTRSYPHTPGIDAAGVVESVTGEADGFSVGQRVIVHGGDFGQNLWGGWSELVSVPAALVHPLPDPLDERAAMAYGTAGFTAAMSIDRLSAALTESGSEARVAVSGASGGVGSCAVAMLSRLGYRVTAFTGAADDPKRRERLLALGAAEVRDRSELSDESGRPLLSASFDAAVDTVGGAALATLIRRMAPGGVVTACGLTAGTELPLTVLPFILRGVTLAGIDSVGLAAAERRRIWGRAATDLRVPAIEEEASTCTLETVIARAQSLLTDSHVGRTVVRVAADG